MKGTRVQSIIRELRGEKIDIVEWSEDPILFVTNAISPAKVQRVSIVDDVEKVMEVIVEDKQLSLAIGKKGQNVRLAAKLTGWKIDIKSEEDKRREVEAQFGELEAGAGEGAGLAVSDAAEGSEAGEPRAADATEGAEAVPEQTADGGEPIAEAAAEDDGAGPVAAEAGQPEDGTVTAESAEPGNLGAGDELKAWTDEPSNRQS
jgi:hypothetical protein